MRTAMRRSREASSSPRPMDCSRDAHLSPADCFMLRSAASSASTCGRGVEKRGEERRGEERRGEERREEERRGEERRGEERRGEVRLER
jgi:hypothetical protein